MLVIVRPSNQIWILRSPFVQFHTNLASSLRDQSWSVVYVLEHRQYALKLRVIYLFLPKNLHGADLDLQKLMAPIQICPTNFPAGFGHPQPRADFLCLQRKTLRKVWLIRFSSTCQVSPSSEVARRLHCFPL